MNVGDILNLEIIRHTPSGEGIALIEGAVCFVAYTVGGDKVSARITEKKRSYMRAEVIKLLYASGNRVAPVCPVYYKCGSCSLMHIDSKTHGELKRAEIISDFKKYAGAHVSPELMKTAGSPLGYRNKVQLPIGRENGKTTVGYYKSGTHKIISVNGCPLHGEWAEPVINAFKAYADACKLSVYDETSGRGLLRHLVLRKVGNNVAVVVVINGVKLPYADKLISALVSENLCFSLHISVNTHRTNVIMGDKLILLYGENNTNKKVNNLNIRVSPLSFLQVNDAVAELIYSDLSAAIASNFTRPVIIEGYSGIGMLSNLLAPLAHSVYCVEVVKSAVRDAICITAENGSGNITNICGDAAMLFPILAAATHSDSVRVITLTDAHYNALTRCGEVTFSGDYTGSVLAVNSGDGSFAAATAQCRSDNGFSSVGGKSAALTISALRPDVLDRDTETMSSPGDGVLKLTDYSYLSHAAKNVLSNAQNTAINSGADFTCSGNSTLRQSSGDNSVSNVNTSIYACLSAANDYDNSQFKTTGVGASACADIVAVLDPPRKGCDQEVLQSLIDAEASAIFYVSCNPSTLARDYAFLSTHYSIKSLTPYDMFPNTAHVECVCFMTRNK